MLIGIKPKALFRQTPKLRFSPELSDCPVCGGKLKVRKTRNKTIGTLDMGMVKIHETLLECSICKNIYRSADLLKLVPQLCKFSYDIIVYIGKAMFLQCKNELKIKEELEAKGIRISASEISYLGRKFIIYLAIIHREMSKKLKDHMNSQGGYILHLDSTCEGDSPHLMSGLDGISHFILKNIKIPSEKKDAIVPFLKEIKQIYGKPRALVHDMGKGILSAVGQVFPNTLDFICHFHFLRDIGKDLFGKENDILRDQLRKYSIQSTLRKRIVDFKKKINKDPQSIRRLLYLLKEGRDDGDSSNYAPEASLYILFLWALDGKKQGSGYGFPFDRPYLAFYRRIETLSSVIKQLRQALGNRITKSCKLYTKVLKELSCVIRDSKLKKAASQMEEKCKVFDKLRSAMRIALPSGKLGLNDSGSMGNIKTIEKKVKAFYEWLCKYNNKSKEDYQKMIQQIKKYWEKLFADPICVDTPHGKVIILPQRTNNIIEQFFRDFKRSHCKRSGFVSINKTLKTMLADTPLVKNLENHKYMEIILDGKASLEECFAEIDSKKVQEELLKSKNTCQKIPVDVLKIIKEPKLPEAFSVLFMG